MQPELIQASAPTPDMAERVAAALRRRYGPDAGLVARRQLEEADGDNRLTWQAVCDRI